MILFVPVLQGEPLTRELWRASAAGNIAVTPLYHSEA